MLVSLASLKSVLRNNVCEIKFARRRPRPGKPMTRRMLCTNAQQLLNSVDGRVALNYKPPLRGLRYNPDEKNIVVVWDVFMQDFRCVSTDSCDLITSIPAGPAFWKYFKENLAKMSTAQKVAYMDS